MENGKSKFLPLSSLKNSPRDSLWTCHMASLSLSLPIVKVSVFGQDAPAHHDKESSEY